MITPLSVLFFAMVQCFLMAHPQTAKAREQARATTMMTVYDSLNFVPSSAMTSALAATAEDVKAGDAKRGLD